MYNIGEKFYVFDSLDDFHVGIELKVLENDNLSFNMCLAHYYPEENHYALLDSNGLVVEEFEEALPLCYGYFSLLRKDRDYIIDEDINVSVYFEEGMSYDLNDINNIILMLKALLLSNAFSVFTNTPMHEEFERIDE